MTKNHWINNFKILLFVLIGALFLVGPFVFQSSHAAAASLSGDGQISASLVQGGGGKYEAATLAGWRIMFGLATAFLVVVLLFLAFVNILHINYDTYQIQKALPMLLAGYVMAAFSLFICRMFVDAAGVLSFTFTKGNAFTNIYIPLATNLGTWWGGVGVVGGIAALIFGMPLIGIGLLLVGGIVVLLPVIALIVVWFLTSIRIAVILLLAVLAPAAFVALGFPVAQSLFKQWWTNWTKWVFLKPIMFLILWLAVILGGGSFSWTSWLITLGLTYFAFTVPLTLGGQVMGAWLKFGQSISGTGKGGYLTKFVGSTAARGGKSAGAMLINPNSKFLGGFIGKTYQKLGVNTQQAEDSVNRQIKRNREWEWQKRGQDLAARRRKPGYKLAPDDPIIIKENYKIWADEQANYDNRTVPDLGRELRDDYGPDKVKRFLDGTLRPDEIDDARPIGAILANLQRRQNNLKEMEEVKEEFGILEGRMGLPSETLANVGLVGGKAGVLERGGRMGGGPTGPTPGGTPTDPDDVFGAASGGGRAHPANAVADRIPAGGGAGMEQFRTSVAEATNYLKEMGAQTESLGGVIEAIQRGMNPQQLQTTLKHQVETALAGSLNTNMRNTIQMKLKPKLESGQFQAEFGKIQTQIQKHFDNAFADHVTVPLRLAMELLPQDIAPENIKAAATAQEAKIRAAMEQLKLPGLTTAQAQQIIVKIDPRIKAVVSPEEARRHAKLALGGTETMMAKVILEELEKQGLKLTPELLAKAKDQFIEMSGVNPKEEPK